MYNTSNRHLLVKKNTFKIKLFNMENNDEKAKSFYTYRTPRRDSHYRNSCQYKARDKARSIACINQLKQISLAFKMYANDYDGLIPPILNNSSNYYYSPSQFLVKGHYINDKATPNRFSTNATETLNARRAVSIFKCPSFQDSSWYNMPINYMMFQVQMIDFVGNSPRPANFWNGWYPTIKKVKKPSKTALMIDPLNKSESVPYLSAGRDQNGDGFIDKKDITAGGNYGWSYHGGMYNVSFYDGHAKAHKSIDLKWRDPSRY